jgi:enamine deaminase RidA (YjgF/YER057c/UK114 family)
MVFSGGVFGIDRDTGELAADSATQTAWMFSNVTEILDAANADPGDVGQMTVWLVSSEDRPVLNEQWVKMFPDPASRPARHVVISPLPSGALVQCQFTAVVRDRNGGTSP